MPLFNHVLPLQAIIYSMKKLSVLRVAHERGKTLEEIASKIGISPRSLRSRTNGNPKLSNLYEIAEAIGCDITDLFR